MSIRIQLDKNAAEDAKIILQLKKMGMSDEEIQEIYDRSHPVKSEDDKEIVLN